MKCSDPAHFTFDRLNSAMPPKMKPVAGVDSFVVSLGRGSLFQDNSHLIDFSKNASNKTKWILWQEVQRCSYAWDHEQMKNFLFREFENSCDPEQWEEKNMASSFDVLEMKILPSPKPLRLSIALLPGQ